MAAARTTVAPALQGQAVQTRFGPVRHVVFDLDGTLVDSRQQIVTILNGMLKERGCADPIDLETARPHMSAGGLHLVSTLLGPWCGDPEQELIEFRRRYREGGTSSDALFAGVSEGLERLHESGLSLGVCSNKPQDLCEKVLGDVALAAFFGAVVGGTSTLRAKPAPDMLSEVLNQLGARPDETLYVGDSELDYLLARSCEVPFLFVTYGYAEPGWWPVDCDEYGSFAEVTGAIIDLVSQQGRSVSGVSHA